MGPEGRGTGSGELIGASTVVTLQGFDQPLAFEPAQRLVERARCQSDLRKVFDVLGQGVAVLGPSGQAGEDEGRRTCIATEGSERWLLARRGDVGATHGWLAEGMRGDYSVYRYTVKQYNGSRTGVAPGERKEGTITKAVEHYTSMVPSGVFLSLAIGSIGLAAAM